MQRQANLYQQIQNLFSDLLAELKNLIYILYPEGHSCTILRFDSYITDHIDVFSAPTPFDLFEYLIIEWQDNWRCKQLMITGNQKLSHDDLQQRRILVKQYIVKAEQILEQKIEKANSLFVDFCE